MLEGSAILTNPSRSPRNDQTRYTAYRHVHTRSLDSKRKDGIDAKGWGVSQFGNPREGDYVVE